MSDSREVRPDGFARFRVKLMVSMMLVIGAVSGLAIYLVGRNITANAEREMQREFQREVDASRRVQELRHAALAERCRALVRRPRIHAALEDNALDLLYLSARDELRDVTTAGAGEASADTVDHVLQATFYRFLDGKGAVIPPAASAADAGELRPDEEGRLSLPSLPAELQAGTLLRRAKQGATQADEIIAMPILSTETGEVIAAIVLGFRMTEAGAKDSGIRSGRFTGGHLHLPSLPRAATDSLRDMLAASVSGNDDGEGSMTADAGGEPHLVFYKRINPGSLFAPSYEVSLFPLAASLARQRHVQWQLAFVGFALLLGGLVASHFIAVRFSVPVEKLAVDSEVNRVQRVRAEAALEQTNVELQRSVRFSADASHQLKTPVAVLRAGLEELRARRDFAPEVREEVASLIHQTFRLTSMIEDLLLLSRMDAGRLQLDFSPVDLNLLVETLIDDLSAWPDELDITVESDIGPGLKIAGESRYTALLLQNLLENARKYNRDGGTIRINAHDEGEFVRFTVGNNGRSIPLAAQEHVFERFHRAAAGENVPGHGLGLNLARELALIHGGDLRLVRSADDWTEFEVRFRSARKEMLNHAGAA